MSEELRCPACGSRQFLVGQYVWETQYYDDETGEWGSSEHYEGDIATGVRCADCEHDCTHEAVFRGWPIAHDVALTRTCVTVDGSVDPDALNQQIEQARLRLQQLLDIREAWAHQVAEAASRRTNQAAADMLFGKEAP